VATTQEDINRALTHTWVDSEDTTQCSKCLLILPKETLVENVPECSGVPGRLKK
jgi:hypothetical protein